MATLLRWPVVVPDPSCTHTMTRRAVHHPGDTPTHIIECSVCSGTFAALIAPS